MDQGLLGARHQQVACNKAIDGVHRYDQIDYMLAEKSVKKKVSKVMHKLCIK